MLKKYWSSGEYPGQYFVFILEEGGERIGMAFRKYSSPTQTLVVQQLMFVLIVRICFTLPRLVMKLTILR